MKRVTMRYAAGGGFMLTRHDRTAHTDDSTSVKSRTVYLC